MPMSRRLNRECPCEARGYSASTLFASSLRLLICACLGLGRFLTIGNALDSSHTLLRTLDLDATLVVLTSLIATRAVNGRLYSALMYDWNTRVRAGLGSSWVARVLFSVRVPK